MITQSATAAPRHSPGRQEPPAPAKAAGIVVGLTLVVAILFVAFALPAATSKPHDLPIGLTGPAPAVAQIDGVLDQTAPGGFATTTYGDQGALRTAIRNRDVYGGIALGPEGTTVLVASGGSPMVAQMLTQIGGAMAERSGMPVATEDLAPLPPQDPRGIGLAAAALPLTLAGLLPAIVLVLAFPNRPWLQLGTLLSFAGAAALTVAALLRHLLHAIEINFWGVTAALFLGIAATGLAVLGLGSLFGRVGLGIGAATAVLLGNPLSGLNSAPEMLPTAWATLGQSLPPGANATLLRSTAYFSDVFPDGRAGTAILVLGSWAAAGLLMVAVAGLKRRT